MYRNSEQWPWWRRTAQRGMNRWTILLYACVHRCTSLGRREVNCRHPWFMAYIYIYIYIYIYTHTHTQICIYMHTWKGSNVRMTARVYKHTFAHIRIYVYVYIYIYVHIFMYDHTCLHITYCNNFGRWNRYSSILASRNDLLTCSQWALVCFSRHSYAVGILCETIVRRPAKRACINAATSLCTYACMVLCSLLTTSCTSFFECVCLRLQGRHILHARVCMWRPQCPSDFTNNSPLATAFGCAVSHSPEPHEFGNAETNTCTSRKARLKPDRH